MSSTVSAAAQARRLDVENKGGRLQTVGRENKGKNMTEQIIQAKSGTYGRVQVTLLMPVKEEILYWAKQMGINKAAFLRMALMLGASQLTKQIIINQSINLEGEELP